MYLVNKRLLLSTTFDTRRQVIIINNEEQLFLVVLYGEAETLELKAFPPCLYLFTVICF